jgi:hypothetical protein
VEILKQPTCIGPARQLILDQLENCHRRPLNGHWELVRFAQEKMGLNFTDPPPTLRLVSERAGTSALAWNPLRFMGLASTASTKDAGFGDTGTGLWA